MREYLTSSDICNQICMERSSFDGLYLVVEGVTDERLYEKFIDKDAVRIVEAHSKDNVRGTVRCMSSDRRDPKVIGIVDADLDRLEGKEVSPPLFHTDCRDMEMMIIRTDALDDVLDEFSDHVKLRYFSETYGPVRDRVVDSGFPIGLLMQISHLERLSLSFKNLYFEEFIDTRDLTINIRHMVDAVLANSRPCRLGRKALVKRLNDAMAELKDPWLAVRGHDAVSILLLALQRNFGAFNSHNLNEGELGGSLRLAFSDEYFRGTQLYKDTSKWAESKELALWDVIHNRNPIP